MPRVITDSRRHIAAPPVLVAETLARSHLLNPSHSIPQITALDLDLSRLEERQSVGWTTSLRDAILPSLHLRRHHWFRMGIPPRRCLHLSSLRLRAYQPHTLLLAGLTLPHHTLHNLIILYTLHSWTPFCIVSFHYPWRSHFTVWPIYPPQSVTRAYLTLFYSSHLSIIIALELCCTSMCPYSLLRFPILGTVINTTIPPSWCPSISSPLGRSCHRPGGGRTSKAQLNGPAQDARDVRRVSRPADPLGL